MQGPVDVCPFDVDHPDDRRAGQVGGVARDRLEQVVPPIAQPGSQHSPPERRLFAS